MKSKIKRTKMGKGKGKIEGVIRVSDQEMRKMGLEEQQPMKDERLDKIVPLLTDIIGRLLAAKGMLRYRSTFVDQIREIMK